MLRQTWEDVCKLFMVAIVLDVIYQVIVLHWIYPVQTLIVASVLAIVPYMVVRGPTRRIVSEIRLRPTTVNQEVSPRGPVDKNENGPSA